MLMGGRKEEERVRYVCEAMDCEGNKMTESVHTMVQCDLPLLEMRLYISAGTYFILDTTANTYTVCYKGCGLLPHLLILWDGSDHDNNLLVIPQMRIHIHSHMCICVCGNGL